MKKMVLLSLIVTVVVGCALFQKPPTDPVEKTAWINKTLDSLDNAYFYEGAAFLVFGGFCLDGIIPAPVCTIGNAADADWQKDYPIAKKAVSDYGDGLITQSAAQKLVDQALVIDLVNAIHVFKAPAAQLVKQKSLQMKQNLSKPTGIRQKPK